MQIIRGNEIIDNTKIQVKSRFFRTLEDFIEFTKTLKNKTICYAHNLSYEFSFLVREVNNGLDDNYLNIFRNTNDCLLSHLKDIKNVEFRDSLCLLRKSIKDLGEDIDYEKLEIDYEQTLHYYDTLEDIQYDYNERDNIIALLSISDFLQHKANLIGVNSVKNLPTTSTRYVKECLKLFGIENFPVKSKSSKIKNGYDQAIAKRIKSLDSDYKFYKTCKLAFRGGLVCSNPYYTPKYNGNKWLNDVYHIDISSSYVHVMLNTLFPYFSKKSSVEIEDKEKQVAIIAKVTNQINEISKMLNEDEYKVFYDYLKHHKFKLNRFLLDFELNIEKTNPVIEVITGDKNKNYNHINPYVKTSYSDDIYKGIIIKYQDRIYDYSINERDV